MTFQSIEEVDRSQPDEIVEEEVISLQPIGPGMQNLELDKPDGRTTPGFPVAGRGTPFLHKPAFIVVKTNFRGETPP